MATSHAGPVLDHIVLLIPHAALFPPPSWLTDAFAVLKGGAHAGGQTENNLIVFRDGVYIELIAFVDGLGRGQRESHRWGSRPEGQIIDWASTVLSPGDEQPDGPERLFGSTVQRRVREADTGVVYSDPAAGGRTTPDGTVLKWAISAPGPDISLETGQLPFWCLDRTPRHLRVPATAGNTAHPSGAEGVASLSVFVKDQTLFQVLRRTYDAIYGVPGETEELTRGVSRYGWEIYTPAHVEAGRRRFFYLYPSTEYAFDLAQLARLSGELPAAYIKLALLSSSGSGKISGSFVGGGQIEIELVSTRD